MKKIIPIVLLIFCSTILSAQDYFPKNDGVKEENNNYTAFTNATLFISPTQKVENGTLLIQKGKVVAAGNSVKIPANTVMVDLKGKFVYPSFIDSYTGFGVEKPKRPEGNGRSPQYEPTRDGYYWNDHIMPETNAIEKFKYDQKAAEELRKAGFGVVGTHVMDGIARGTGTIIALNDSGTDANRIIKDKAGNYFSFEKSVVSRQSYPTSLMGAMALLRQMYWDADWYEKGNVPTTDRSLQAFNQNKNLISFFEAGSQTNDVRADKIGDLFGINYVIIGGGNEYEKIAAIKNTAAKYIIPINFPEATDVSNPYAENYLSIEDMRAWNQAPTNPKIMAENGIPFALTTFQLKSPSDFKTKLLQAILYGFDKTKALEALTTVPAEIMGEVEHLGSLQPGRYANFLITSGDIFDKETTLYENWVQGEKNVINDIEQKDIRGSYAVTIGGKVYNFNISGDLLKLKSEVKLDSIKYPSNIDYNENWVTLSFTDEETKEVYRTTGLVPHEGDDYSGRLLLPTGEKQEFTAKRNKDETSETGEEKEKKVPEKHELVPITFPNVGYGNTEKPKPQNMLFKNATVWTSEDNGVLENTDVLVKDGKIAKIGKDLSAGNALTIDASGKYLTAGIIDEHSHIATLEVNEAGQNSSAEVTIEDVVDPKDISIYRDLAGGVTSVQILHGSANPIGGRSAIVKLKWGEDADKMIYENTPKFIKFALGENVKQSNWESYTRFPQTRMGVEQTYVNYFNRAREYDALKKGGKPYRHDEEMEVLGQILNGERFITCHSYVQSEINMLMKVADKFGFRVNTFTHILEGYKVADKMKAHGVGASTFSDWWAYKYEVNDAIPYNAAIMQSQGLIVAVNSDDAEMSRRLNQEAAKSIKYGGMDPQEAWKMVTINPAKLLHLDNRTGSIKEGKDADLVLWNENPLSVYAKPIKTIIDGTVYFDIEKDAAQREAIKAEKNKLVTMMLKEKNSGSKTKDPEMKDKRYFECETIN